jgi:hypothetical protein
MKNIAGTMGYGNDKDLFQRDGSRYKMQSYSTTEFSIRSANLVLTVTMAEHALPFTLIRSCYLIANYMPL